MFERLRQNIARHVALGEDEFRRLASMLECRHVKRKDSLLRPGETCLFEGFVTAGCLRVYWGGGDGSEQVLYFAPEDCWIPDVQTFASQSPASLGIQALETTDVLLIDQESKERLCAEIPKVERLFRIITQGSLVTVQHRMIALMRQTAEERYVDFKRRYPLLDGRIPQYHIASYLGICPEFLSKIRRKMASRFS